MSPWVFWCLFLKLRNQVNVSWWKSLCVSCDEVRLLPWRRKILQITNAIVCIEPRLHLNSKRKLLLSYDDIISIIQVSPNLTGICWPSCCRRLRNIVLSERGLLLKPLLKPRDLNKEVLSILHICLNWK